MTKACHTLWELTKANRASSLTDLIPGEITHVEPLTDLREQNMERETSPRGIKSFVTGAREESNSPNRHPWVDQDPPRLLT